MAIALRSELPSAPVQPEQGNRMVSQITHSDWDEAVFDALARTLATNIPRRKAFALLAKGTVGVLLAQFGVRSAWAQTCLCAGEIYDPISQCCTSSGVQ